MGCTGEARKFGIRALLCSASASSSSSSKSADKKSLGRAISRAFSNAYDCGHVEAAASVSLVLVLQTCMYSIGLWAVLTGICCGWIVLQAEVEAIATAVAISTAFTRGHVSGCNGNGHNDWHKSQGSAVAIAEARSTARATAEAVARAVAEATNWNQIATAKAQAHAIEVGCNLLGIIWGIVLEAGKGRRWWRFGGPVRIVVPV